MVTTRLILSSIFVTQLMFYVRCWEGDHHAVPTYFWRRHKDGSLIDRTSPEYEEIENVPRVNKISREDAGTVQLHAYPATVKHGGKVTIQWSNLTNRQPKDYIAFFCPYYDAFGHYLDYFWINSVPGHANGSGHVEHTLYNMRETCAFRLYRQVWQTKTKYIYQLSATSNLIDFADGGALAPLQGHIALTNDPTEMRVMWVSGEVDHPPFVRYGVTKELKQTEYRTMTRTYNADSMCQGNANGRGFWNPGMIHDVLLKGLEPNTMYYYSYGIEGYTSEILNFTTALPMGDPTPFTFIVCGDMGVLPPPNSYTTAQSVRKEIDTHKARYVFHIGDISYARGWAYIWEHWAWLVEPYSTLMPYMVAIGNHEYDHTAGGLGRDPSKVKTDGGWRPKWFNGGTDSGGECGVALHKRFHMPDNGNSLFWYSFDYGMVHMITMSTEHDYSVGSDQYVWLENDLKNVDRKVTPWVILGGHRPMYNSQKYYSDYVVVIHQRQLLEDLLYKYKVDMAVWGHYHSYERTCKLYKEKCVQDGIQHITIGNAGFNIDRAGWYPKDWSLVRITEAGYGRVTVANKSSLLFEVIINKEAAVKDHVWLHK